MKNYEFIYLISPELFEEDRKDFQSKIISFIQENEGTLDNVTNPVIKKLFYPIKKKNQAFLGVLDFYLEPSNLKNFEKKVKKQNQILRYLILEKKILKIPSKIRKEFLFTKKKMVEKPKIKVEIKEIEKKLEEILSEN